jgi:hypothetical protein
MDPLPQATGFMPGILLTRTTRHVSGESKKKKVSEIIRNGHMPGRSIGESCTTGVQQTRQGTPGIRIALVPVEWLRMGFDMMFLILMLRCRLKSPRKMRSL